MRIVFGLTAILLLAGCGNAIFDDGVRAAVRKRLKDPDSAKFEEILRYKNFACIKYNAKNGYGGYGGASWAVLELTGSTWYVRDMEEDVCYEFQLQRMAEPEQAALKDAADATILDEFKRRGLINPSARYYEIPSGPCGTVASELTSFAHLQIEATNDADRTKWKSKYDASFKKLDKVRCE
ncbi:MAG: hypothetical protein AB1807_15085 [Pseudomonadota bacterium]